MRPKNRLNLAVIAVVLSALWLTGCSVLGIAEKLPSAIAGHTDPDTVREAMPAYLTLADAMVLEDPDDEDTLLAAAKLYLAFGAIFVEGGKQNLYEVRASYQGIPRRIFDTTATPVFL